MFGDLLVEMLPAAGDRAQGVLGGGFDGADLSWPQALTSAGLRPVQRRIRAILDKGWSCSRSSSGALTMTVFNEIIAAVRALTAMSLATLICRIISTVPSAVFGVAVAWPPSTARAAFSASRKSDLPRSRRSRRSVRMTSTTPMSLRRTAAVRPAPYEPVPSIAKVRMWPRRLAQVISSAYLTMLGPPLAHHHSF